MNQRDLFSAPPPETEVEPPCQRHSATSREAAEQVKGVTGRLRKRVLDFLIVREELGATDEEMQQLLGMPQNTHRPRRCELVKMGLVKDSGVTRRTKAGRKAVVWVAVEVL